MTSTFLYAFISVLAVSLISFVGLFTLSIKSKNLKKILLYIISFSAGALLGDAFIHLLPEIISKKGFTLQISIYTLTGITIFFILEKFIHWEHCHGHLTEENHIHPFAYTNLIGDGFHNFLDGVIIAASYLISTQVGIATTLAVLLHEIPQEIGDFGVLLHGGFTKTKALLLNFASALLAVIGVITTFLIGSSIGSIETILIPIAAGGFIYIASSDLIPELHKTTDMKKSIIQLISFILGIATMTSLLLLE